MKLRHSILPIKAKKKTCTKINKPINIEKTLNKIHNKKAKSVRRASTKKREKQLAVMVEL
jgi:hypothetical protein